MNYEAKDIENRFLNKDSSRSILPGVYAQARVQSTEALGSLPLKRSTGCASSRDKISPLPDLTREIMINRGGL